MSGILSLFLLLSAGSFAGLYSKKCKYEVMLPITCLGIVLALFLFGLMGLLRQGMAFVWVCAAAAYVVFFMKAWKICRKQGFQALRQCLRETVFTPGMLFFLALYGMVLIINNGKEMASFDEFSHWGIVVKQMLLTDALSTGMATDALLFRSYPPGMALFQYAVEKTCLAVTRDKGVSEGLMYVTYQLLAYALLMPFLKKASFRQPYTWVICAVLTISPIAIFPDAMTSLYIDSFLGLLAGAGMAAAVTAEEGDWPRTVYVLLAIVMLVLTKDAGLLFAVFLAAAYIWTKWLALYRETGRTKSRYLIAASVAIVLPKALWELSILLHQIPKNFSRRVELISLLRVLFGQERSYRRQVLKNYLFALFDDAPKTFIGSSQPWYLWFVLLTVVLYAGFRLLLVEKPKERSIKAVFWLIIAETAVYVAGLCVMYMYKFSEYEALELASLTRYLQIGLNLLWFSGLLLIINSTFSDRRDPSMTAALLLLGCLFMINGEVMRDSFSSMRATGTQIARQEVDDFGKKLEQATEEDCSVYIVTGEDRAFDAWILRYLALPRKVNDPRNWEEYMPSGEDTDALDKAKKWQSQLLDRYDYVAICHFDPAFPKTFAFLFQDEDQICEGGIYRVNRESGQLVPVN